MDSSDSEVPRGSTLSIKLTKPAPPPQAFELCPAMTDDSVGQQTSDGANGTS